MSKAESRASNVQEWRTQPLREVTPPRGLIAGTKYSVLAIWQQRELLRLLIQRELKARYKDSILGVFWSLAKPLVQLLIFYIAVGKFLGAERSIPEFAIFVFAGLTLWGLFFDIMQTATKSIVSNAGLIKKVYLPRELFPLAATGSALFGFFTQLIILFAATLVVSQFPLNWDLLYAPIGALLVLTFAFAFGLLLSALTVYFRDIEHLIEVVLLVLFWASPIVYSYGFVHEYLQGNWLEQLYLANPITVGLLAFQKGIWVAGADQQWPADLDLRLGVMLLVSFVFVLVSQRIFARLEGNFAQEI